MLISHHSLTTEPFISGGKLSFNNILHQVNTSHSFSKTPSPYDYACSSSAPSSPQSSISSFSPEPSSVDSPRVSNIYKLLNFEPTDDSCSSGSGSSYEFPTPTTDSKQVSKPFKVSTMKLRPVASKDISCTETWHTRPLANMTAVHRVHPYQPSQSYLNRNQEDSVDRKMHSCQFPGCPMRFKRLEHLKRHFRVHTLERPYTCEFDGCGKTFSRRDNLGQHMKTHDKTKNNEV
ncbi:hypothetical protein K7432_014833 [Basidiobolus ranarum]|uniref:C2H2-type domain-containing protein n=1 Tax=Basidiobolus ranarum TaxID=34480 RepID=A0ABR2WH52_9FUNG